MPDIAAYFGSFDPVTRGHLEVTCRALREGHAEHIIIIVKPSPFKCHLLERKIAARLFEASLPDELRERVVVKDSNSPKIYPPALATKYLRGIRNHLDVVCENEVQDRIFKDAAELACQTLPIITIMDEPNLKGLVSSTHVRDLLFTRDLSLKDLIPYIPEYAADILHKAYKETAPDKMRPETISAFNQMVASNLG